MTVGVSNQQKLEKLICDSADIVYNKYQMDAYFLVGCSEPFDEAIMEKNKLMIDLLKYIKCSPNPQCKI